MKLEIRHGRIGVEHNGRDFQWSTRPLSVRSGPAERELDYALENRGAVTVLKVAGRDIEAPLVFRFPLPDSAYPFNLDWKVWTAGRDYPMDLFGMIGHQILYDPTKLGALLPSLSLYNAVKDIGVTFTKPFGRMIPEQRFAIRAEDDRSFDVIYTAFATGAIAEFALEVYAHRGDYRCALGALYEAYHEYFDPNNPGVQKQWFFFSASGIKNEDPIDKIAALKPHVSGDLYAEVHHIFPSYGDYFPERDAWMNVRATEPGNEKRAVHITKTEVMEHLAELNSLGIRPLLYIQLGGDCWRKLIEEQFPDSPAHDEDGRLLPAWMGGVIVNSSTRFSFGKHLKATLERMLELADGRIAGFFFDVPGHGYLDFNHSDGISEKNGKPAFRMSEAYREHLDRLLPILREKNLFIMSGGGDIETCKSMDAMMAEGAPWLMQYVSGVTIARPLIAFCYTDDPFLLESAFLTALKYGAFPGCPSGNLNKVYPRLLDQYDPFYRLLAGRKWVFEPKPLELQQGWDGNLFELPDGRYVLFVFKTLGIAGPALEIKVKLGRIAEYAVDRVFTLGGRECGHTSEYVCFSRDMTVEDSLTFLELKAGKQIPQIKEEYLRVKLDSADYVYAIVLQRKEREV